MFSRGPLAPARNSSSAKLHNDERWLRMGMAFVPVIHKFSLEQAESRYRIGTFSRVRFTRAWWRLLNRSRPQPRNETRFYRSETEAFAPGVTRWPVSTARPQIRSHLGLSPAKLIFARTGNHLIPTTIESGPQSGSTRVSLKPASRIQPLQSAPVKSKPACVSINMFRLMSKPKAFCCRSSSMIAS